MGRSERVSAIFSHMGIYNLFMSKRSRFEFWLASDCKNQAGIGVIDSLGKFNVVDGITLLNVPWCHGIDGKL
jgi:hypothetical protein